MFYIHLITFTSKSCGIMNLGIYDLEQIYDHEIFYFFVARTDEKINYQNNFKLSL